jgi:diketogulonate reductase-like aldo/keto reductase
LQPSSQKQKMPSKFGEFALPFLTESLRSSTGHVKSGDLYNLDDRGIEHDLLPWCERHSMPVMACSPLGGLGASLLRDPMLARIAVAHSCSAAAFALAWTIRSGHVIAIPESGSVAHVSRRALTDTDTGGT